MGKLNYLLAAFFLLFPHFIAGQYQLEWEHIFSRTENSMDMCEKIGADDFGNYYVSGTSFAPGIGGGTIVIKYNDSGDTVWTKIYPGSLSGINLIVNGNGDFYISKYNGNTFKCNSNGDILWSSNYQASLVSMAVDAASNTYVISEGGFAGLKTIKYDSNGNELWVRNYDNAWGVKVIIDNEGNVLVGGNAGASNEDFLALKYNPQGDLLWSQTYRRSNIAGSLTAIAIDNLNNVILGGYAPESVTNFYHDFTVVKFNSQGQFQWARFYNGPNNRHDILVDVAPDNEGNIFVGGNSFDQSSASTAVILKYSPVGDSLGGFLFNGEPEIALGLSDGSSHDTTTKVVKLKTINDGSVRVLIRGFIDFHWFYESADLVDHVLLSLMGLVPAGVFTGRDALIKDTQLLDKSSGRSVNPDIVITGDVVNPSLNRFDIITAKFSNKTVNVEDKINNPNDFLLYQNYPNPFNPSTTLSFDIGHSSFVTLKVFDLLGREVTILVDEYKPAGSYKIEFDASIISSGVYTYMLQAGEYMAVKKLLLIK